MTGVGQKGSRRGLLGVRLPWRHGSAWISAQIRARDAAALVHEAQARCTSDTARKISGVPHPLDGCNAKLDRAHEHLDTLTAAYREYLDSKPYVADQEARPDDDEIRFIGRVVVPPPLRLGTILGDLIHNLRSALDHIAWQLVVHIGKTPTRDNQFPICTDKDDWGKTSARSLARVRKAHLDLIETFQPFHSPIPDRAPLARLHRLWNQDKHQVVTTVLAATRDPSDATFITRPIGLDKFKAVQDIEKMVSADGYYGTPLDGHLLARLKIKASGPEPKAEMLSQWIAGLALEDGESVELTINEMASSVERIVNTFGPLLSPET